MVLIVAPKTWFFHSLIKKTGTEWNHYPPSTPQLLTHQFAKLPLKIILVSTKLDLLFHLLYLSPIFIICINKFINISIYALRNLQVLLAWWFCIAQTEMNKNASSLYCNASSAIRSSLHGLGTKFSWKQMQNLYPISVCAQSQCNRVDMQLHGHWLY